MTSTRSTGTPDRSASITDVAGFAAQVAALDQASDPSADALVELFGSRRQRAFVVDADDRAIGALFRRTGESDEKFHELSS